MLIQGKERKGMRNAGDLESGETRSRKKAKNGKEPLRQRFADWDCLQEIVKTTQQADIAD